MWLFELFFPQFCKSDISISESPSEFEITRVDYVDNEDNGTPVDVQAYLSLRCAHHYENMPIQIYRQKMKVFR